MTKLQLSPAQQAALIDLVGIGWRQADAAALFAADKPPTRPAAAVTIAEAAAIVKAQHARSPLSAAALVDMSHRELVSLATHLVALVGLRASFARHVLNLPRWCDLVIAADTAATARQQAAQRQVDEDRRQ